MLRQLRSVFNSVGTAIRQDPEVGRLLAAHPRLARFISNRLSPREPFGLRLTVGVVLGWIFLSLFFGVLRALFEHEPLVLADLRVLSLVQIFRSPNLDRVMLFITYLGNWEIVGSGIVLLNVYLFLSRRFSWLAALNVSWLGGEAFVWVSKTLVGRARPDLITALIPAHGPSFPSGHAFVAFSFYGLVAWFVIKTASTKWWKVLVAIVAVFVVLAIGLSRIYLGVHWPTDVLASLAAGAAWLTIIIIALTVSPARGVASISSWPHTSQGRIVGGILLVAWVGIVVGFYETHPLSAPAGKAPEAPVALQEGDIPITLFSYVSGFSENILGRPEEPINVILIGSDIDLRRAFQEAGWLPADPITIASAWRLLIAELFGRPDPRAPGLPVFWDARPNPFSFERPTPANTAQERHHLHLWNTQFSVGGRPVWLGTVHLDKKGNLAPGVPFPIHEIDPAIDKERESLRSSLASTTCVDHIRDVNVTEPMLGQNALHSPFFTDGKAIVVGLNCR
jgi:membrane-associated phospholipid phosphatase